MRWADIPWNPAERLLRQFAGLWLLFFGVIALLQLGSERHWVAPLLALLALTVGGIGLVRPRWIRPVFVTCTVLTFPIGWLVLNSCLAVVFFGLFTPLGLVFRLLGRDVLGVQRRRGKESYLEPKPVSPVGHYYRPF